MKIANFPEETRKQVKRARTFHFNGMKVKASFVHPPKKQIQILTELRVPLLHLLAHTHTHTAIKPSMFGVRHIFTPPIQ